MGGMTTKTVTVVIEAGEKTCYAKPGEPCPWVRVSHYGTIWECGIFNVRLKDETGDPRGAGWLQRCETCENCGTVIEHGFEKGSIMDFTFVKHGLPRCLRIVMQQRDQRAAKESKRG